MVKWISLNDSIPYRGKIILFSNGENIYLGWLEAEIPLEGPIFHAFADWKGKTGHRLDYWPDNVTHWTPMLELPEEDK